MVFTQKEAKKKYPDLSPKLNSRVLKDLAVDKKLTIRGFSKLIKKKVKGGK